MNLNETLSDSSRAAECSEGLEVASTNEIADEKFEEVVKRLQAAMLNHPDLVNTLRGIFEPLQNIERYGDALYSLDILSEAERVINESKAT